MAQLGVRNGVKLEATGTRTEREPKWLYSLAVLFGTWPGSEGYIHVR